MFNAGVLAVVVAVMVLCVVVVLSAVEVDELESLLLAVLALLSAGVETWAMVSSLVSVASLLHGRCELLSAVGAAATAGEVV